MNLTRAFNLLLAIAATAVLLVPMLLIALLVIVTSGAPVLYWSERVGKNNVLFDMPKFRTMRTDAPVLPTHLLTNAQAHITKLGAFLRKTSLDELPQLWNILKGEMHFVGPRPALFNQADLIALRTERGVHTLTPGLTGLAQISGRDELDIPEKVKLDAEYLRKQSLLLDVKILWLTAIKIFRREGVAH